MLPAGSSTHCLTLRWAHGDIEAQKTPPLRPLWKLNEVCISGGKRPGAGRLGTLFSSLFLSHSASGPGQSASPKAVTAANFGRHACHLFRSRGCRLGEEGRAGSGLSPVPGSGLHRNLRWNEGEHVAGAAREQLLPLPGAPTSVGRGHEQKKKPGHDLSCAGTWGEHFSRGRGKSSPEECVLCFVSSKSYRKPEYLVG